MSRRVVVACGAVALLCSVSAASAAAGQEPPRDAAAAAAAAAERLKIALEAANVNRIRPDDLESLLEASNRRDFEAAAALFARDAAFEMPRGPEPWGFRVSGRAGIRDALASWFESVPDARFSDATHVVSGNRGFSEWTLTGTTAAGDVVTVRGCDLFVFREKLIVRRDTYLKLVEPAGD